MKSFRVIRTCTFKNKYLEEGRVYNLDDSAVSCRHLELIPKDPVDQKKDEEKPSMVSLSQKQKELSSPKSGFASNLNKKPSSK